MERRSVANRTEGQRNITRLVVLGPKPYRGWNVRVIRRGIRITEFFSDAKFAGTAGALSEAMHFRDAAVKDLRPIPRSELARRKTVRNQSGIPGVRRIVKRTVIGGKAFAQEVWEASGTPQPGRRKSETFSIAKLGEDSAREAAIAQRLRWEKQMERCERQTPRQ